MEALDNSVWTLEHSFDARQEIFERDIKKLSLVNWFIMNWYELPIITLGLNN